MKAGHETDAAVGRACGMEVDVGASHAHNSHIVRRLAGEEYETFNRGIVFPIEWVLFRPSVDMNDAMLAAEKFGLFTKHEGMLMSARNDRSKDWAIFHYIGEREHEFYGDDTEETPALAICAAIMKLGEKANAQ